MASSRVFLGRAGEGGRTLRPLPSWRGPRIGRPPGEPRDINLNTVAGTLGAYGCLSGPPPTVMHSHDPVPGKGGGSSSDGLSPVCFFQGVPLAWSRFCFMPPIGFLVKFTFDPRIQFIYIKLALISVMPSRRYWLRHFIFQSFSKASPYEMSCG